MKDLFGIEVNPKDLLPNSKGGTRKSELAHKMLIELYGKFEGNKCGKCAHFYFNVYSKKYPKCEESGLTGHTQNHDWSSRWEACGKFEIETK